MMSPFIIIYYFKYAVHLPLLSLFCKVYHLNKLTLSNKIADVFQRAEDMAKDLDVVYGGLHNEFYSCPR